jgi:hypothetical protein
MVAATGVPSPALPKPCHIDSQIHHDPAAGWHENLLVVERAISLETKLTFESVANLAATRNAAVFICATDPKRR